MTGPEVAGLEVAGLEVAGLVVRIGRAEVVHGAAFTAPAGAVTAILGPSGAGKSTILRALAGAVGPAPGATIRVHGEDLSALKRRERTKRVALVEQDASTEQPLDVYEVVALGRTPYRPRFGGRDASGPSAIDGALAAARIEHVSDRFFSSLSGGERQRVMLARALAQQPRLLLLDEPTDHLDAAAQLELLAVLHEHASQGMTVVLALHDLTLAADQADAVVVVADGRVVASGPTRETLIPELVGEVYGVTARWTENPTTGRPVLTIGGRLPGRG